MRRDIISTPFDATDEQKKAYELWTSFEKEVIFRTRYYVTHPLLEQLRVYLSKNNLRINAGEVFYRARIITDTAQKDYMMKICAEKDGNYKRFLSKSNKFKGLTKEASFVPTDNLIIKDGRANPRYIKYLYMAEISSNFSAKSTKIIQKCPDMPKKRFLNSYFGLKLSQTSFL